MRSLVVPITRVEDGDRLREIIQRYPGLTTGDTARDAPPAARRVCVVIELPEGPESISQTVGYAALLAAFPSLMVVDCSPLSGTDRRYLVDVVHLGNNEGKACAAEREALLALRHVISGREIDQAAARVMQAIGLALPEPLMPVLHFCLTHATRRLSMREVARGNGLTLKALRTRLRRAGLRKPQAIIGWSLLLLAAAIMEQPDRSLADINAMLGFRSRSALRNLFRRRLGMQPRDVSKRGGLVYVVRAFLRAFAEHEARPDAVERARRASTEIALVRAPARIQGDAGPDDTGTGEEEPAGPGWVILSPGRPGSELPVPSGALAEKAERAG